MTEQFTGAEKVALGCYVTNTDLPVFALTNLPEVVKAAVFARYSRTHKSCRRLLLDEFGITETTSVFGGVGGKEAEALMDRVFVGYGDDSVAQLGGAHLACEGVSNIMTKLLEWSRLGAYLEQSTRYIPYDEKEDGNWKYHCPVELRGHELEPRFHACMDKLFSTYSNLIPPLYDYFLKTGDGDPTIPAYRKACRAKAYDAARGLLPAATKSNLGIYASGQTYERIIMTLRASNNLEAHWYADMMLNELRKVIPAFLQRVDLDDRGVEWIEYMRKTREAMGPHAIRSSSVNQIAPLRTKGSSVTLTDYDIRAEQKVIAAALYAVSGMSDAGLQQLTDKLTHDQKQTILNAYIGDRKNRRHRPGRALERCYYRFDILGDYGAFRDLQRHRMLTIEWQDLSPLHGYIVSPAIAELEGEGLWHEAMGEPAQLWADMQDAGLVTASQYVIPFAYRIRFNLQMHAREAMHVFELRTQEGCHPSYRKVCQEMHRQIRENAGHRMLADAMSFVNHEEDTQGRLKAEQKAEV
jgi:thymidylate synthase ThyX